MRWAEQEQALLEVERKMMVGNKLSVVQGPYAHEVSFNVRIEC